MDIDLVIFYEDDNDPEYQKLREVYIKNGFPILEQDIRERRVFKNKENLKYFIRSVGQHLKFIRYIYIISNYQIPQWLNYRKERIKILSYKTIVPYSMLPTFNYNVIETCFVNIPDIADRFIYATENAFFVKDVDESFFYNERGYPLIRFSDFFSRNRKLKDKENINIKNAINLCEKYFGKRPRFFKNCNIEAYYRPDVVKCLDKIRKEVYKMSYSKFADEDDISRYILTYYSFYNNHATLKYPQLYELTNLAKIFAKYIYYQIKDIQGFNLTKNKYKLSKNTKMFWFFKNKKATEKDEQRAMSFLQKMFPNKSEFEI